MLQRRTVHLCLPYSSGHRTRARILRAGGNSESAQRRNSVVRDQGKQDWLLCSLLAGVDPTKDSAQGRAEPSPHHQRDNVRRLQHD
ncbi:MAG: hypothetical protein UT02_C0019G0004 [Parcubacteria group bacterium GW2011_GWC2_38_7]|nr:MAG: hypothetical protein UT02_C0019G0004 [Parcubacteria group bacterium GW2011_GWC2_38_7]